MKRRRRYAESGAARGVASLDEFPARGSRPSKNKCTTGVSAAESSESASNGETVGKSVSDSYLPEEWWRKKNAIVDRFVEEWSQRAVRPISVRGGTKLRDEATSEKRKGEDRYRSRPWSAVLNEFLKWYNGYRDAYLVFKDPEGEEVRGEMPNSHQPRYGDKYYARLKALERQVIKKFDDPHTVMLTFSGSSRNANGGWRCPADHLRDVIESWRPDRGRGVYHTLRYVLDGKRWEYAIVVEKHQSGYGHVHCAVFVDGEVSESDFHPVIDAHLRVCDIAGREAHDYHSHNENDRPISVRRINPNAHDMEAIGNLGSYIGAYIGAHGKPLFERGLDELIFRASTWATGTRVVRFSDGANELIETDREEPSAAKKPEASVKPNPDFDLEKHAEPGADEFPFEVENPGWDIVGVARIVDEEEQVFEMDRAGVVWREIDDASQLDPPKLIESHKPRIESKKGAISDY